MNDIDEIFRRAHTQQVCSFFMDGVDLDNWYEDEDSRLYEQRIQEEERPIWKLLEEAFPDGKALDEAVDKLSSALAINQRVYMEIGIRAGALLIYDLLRENAGGKFVSKKLNVEKVGM